MQNIRIGVDVSRAPVGVKSRNPARWPSWKIHTMAPNVAVRLSRLSTTAFTGTTTLPVIRNRTVNVTMPMITAASGTSVNNDDLASTSWADGPPERTGNGAGV